MMADDNLAGCGALLITNEVCLNLVRHEESGDIELKDTLTDDYWQLVVPSSVEVEMS